jgi:metacaspase-1
MNQKALKLTTFILLMIPIMLFGQTKRALIVAIGDYPKETKWRFINSLNDVELIQSALENQGFKDFTILRDAEADKKGILAAIAELEEKSDENDILVLHFSSHGQKMADDNGDELDGYDEGIVAYGGPAFFSKDYKDENHLRDDQMGILLKDLRRKVGPDGDVLMIVDACYSGTISRGEISRGGMPPLEDPENPPVVKGDEDVGLFQPDSTSRGSGSNLSPFVLISASQASQVNYEYNGAGSLSTAINRCAGKLDANSTYRSFFAQILKEMSQIAPNQVPAIEGDIDRTLFAGEAVAQELYYTPKKIIELDMNIKGGTLSGLFKNTEIAIYDAGTINTDSSEPLAIGKIINAQNTWSKARLNIALTGNITNYWIFVTKQTYGDIKVKVQINTGNNTMNQTIENSLKGFGLVELVNEKPDFIIKSSDVDGVDLMRNSDRSLFAEQVSTEFESEEIKEKLTNYARGKYFKDLELKYSSINVTFELIPITLEDPESPGDDYKIKDTLTLEQASKNGVLVVSEHVGAHIKVTNHGNSPVYFSIIDIQPDGVINGIIPDPDPESGHQTDQFRIPAKTSYIIPDHRVTFSDPFGTEVFKLFASRKPIDFRPILTGLGRTRSEMSDLEMLFSDSYETATRGAKSGGVSNNMEASTYSVSFQIQPEE